MKAIYLLQFTSWYYQVLKLAIDLMQVLSGGIFNLCLSPFTFFRSNPHYKQYDVIPLYAEHTYIL